MKKYLIITITLAMIISLCSCSSDSSRIDELEKRVEVLENAVGISESNGDINTANNEEVNNTDNEKYRQANTIMLIKDFNNKEETYEGSYYYLYLNGDRCHFSYQDADYTMLACDFSKETYDEVMNMLCSEKLEEYESKTDENGKITDEIIPQILGVNVGAKNIYFKEPSNMSEIVAKFESFKEQAEPVE